MVALSILFVFCEKPWSIQDIKILPQQLNAVPYYIWKLGAATILDYYIDVDVLGMLGET